MNAQIVDKLYEKYAWIILSAIGILTILGGLPHALGINTDPATAESIAGIALSSLQPGAFALYDFYFKFGGWSDVAFAFFLTVISSTAYRKGEKWAWYALWFVPIYFLGSAGIVMSVPAAMSLLPFLAVFTILPVLGLLLPFRKFFPKGE
ncbi:MAG: hypothetical protein KGD60_12510 [Candidatus Thorarchaeota archaeon]|nr:hypothetical protein [Candidatus Thorarchaeota archaeon]